MSTPQFRAGNPLAPEKGAFPLDHFGECAKFKEKYLKCLQVRMFTMLSRALLLKHHEQRETNTTMCSSFHVLVMMMIYTLKQKQKSDANKCKMESKLYLECRMAKELMASQPLAELGFKEDQKEEERDKNKEEGKESTKEENERNGFVAGARRARQQQKEKTEEAYRRRREGR